MTVVDDIKSRLDIMDVVSAYVPLQHSGRNFKANCPFHQERTPSFYVQPDRQAWRCFGACATGGDVFSFIMKAENLEFAEVLQKLADQTGIALPTRERREELDIAYRINEAARDYFQRCLASDRGAATRDYLAGRGLSPASIAKFELGLSPRDGQALFDYLTRQDFRPQQLLQAGIIHESRGGGYRDAFRGRLMIPIRNGAGNLGGFGSRALDAETTPKYLNTARTPVFDKGRTLYALYLAKEAARGDGLVIVEGYMDAIMAHQHGYANVVASMGTALTEQQVAEVRRLTGRVTMALDADAAGRQATLRSLESSWQVFQQREGSRARTATPSQRPNDLDLRIAVLTGGKDPDEIIRQSPESWAEVVSGSVPLFDYLLPTLSTLVDINAPQGKARVVEWLRPFIFSVREPIQQDHYRQKLADHLSISADALRASLSRPLATPRAANPGPARGGASPERNSVFAALNRDPLEDYCLALLLQHSDLAEIVLEESNLPEDYFRRPENREIYTRLHQSWAEAPEFPVPQDALLPAVRERVPAALLEHLEALAARKLPPLPEPRGRVADFRQVTLKLEERHLIDLKQSETAFFADDAAEAVAAAEQAVLEINRKIKTNHHQRREQARNC